MLLVHDLVEIDAGDTFCYDVQGNQNKAVQEAKQPPALWAAKNRGAEILALWEEFEAQETAAALFAAALDRCSLLHNQRLGGGRIHGITHNQVQRRVGCIEEGAPTLWPFVEQIIEDCVVAGYLKPVRS